MFLESETHSEGFSFGDINHFCCRKRNDKQFVVLLRNIFTDTVFKYNRSRSISHALFSKF